MDEWHDDPIMILPVSMVLILVPLLLIGMYQGTFPTTVEGTVISTSYSSVPPWPCTRITITNLGDSPTILTVGEEIRLQTGKTYRITYHNPFGYMYNVIDAIEEIKV